MTKCIFEEKTSIGKDKKVCKKKKRNKFKDKENVSPLLQKCVIEYAKLD